LSDEVILIDVFSSKVNFAFSLLKSILPVVVSIECPAKRVSFPEIFVFLVYSKIIVTSPSFFVIEYDEDFVSS
jgi:hypothetical protein